MSFVSSELVLGRVCQENVSLAADVNEYSVRVKNLEKKMDDEEQIGMAVLRELKRPK